MVGLLIASIAVCIAVLYTFLQQRTNHGKLPPGPPGLPIVGHLTLIGKNPPKKFVEWKKIYGPIFRIKFGSNAVVVLNDAKLIKEAYNMDVFSGRPGLKMFTEISEFKGITWTDGPRVMEQRRFATKSLKQFGIGKSSMDYHVQEELTKFIEDLKLKFKAGTRETKIDIKNFFKFPVVNSIWSIIMGQRLDEDDPTLGRFLEAFDTLAHTSSNVIAQLAWFFPWVKALFSFFGYNPVVKGMRNIYEYMAEHIETQRLNYVPGQPKHYTHAYFDQVAQTTDPQSCFHKSRDEQATATGDIFNGATDTVTTTMDWVLLYMAREPSVQQKLQEEIDCVVGAPGGLNIPSLADRTRMPYTEAVLQELLRISSVTPMGLYRRTMEDISDFNGYKILKNTIIISNFWEAHHDPSIWPDPEKFNPERFLEIIDGKYCKIKSPNDIFAFSFGKRSCPGETMARNNLFLFTTRFFQIFSIACTDQEPSLEGSLGLVVSPKPFQAILKLR